MTIRRSSSSRAGVPWLRIRAAVVSILPTRRPTSYGEQFRARRVNERATKGKCIREFPICGCGLERGERGRDWSAVAECGAELYYGNYMINTTRPWALSSPSWSSFQSRSSARSSSPSVAGISLLSRLGPRLSTRGIVALLIPPFVSSSPLVRPRHRFHERALAVCLKIRLLSAARNAINLIPFRSRLLAAPVPKGWVTSLEEVLPT